MKLYNRFLKNACVYALVAGSFVSSLPVFAKDAEDKPQKTEMTQMEKLRLEHDAAKNVFEATDKNIIFIKDAALKDSPDSKGSQVAEAKKGEEATLIGFNDYADWEVEIDGKTYYVNQHTIEEVVEEAAPAYVWNGPVLTAFAGSIQGPTGKETYYNLPMEGVVSIMRSMGNNDPYWVREDGVKMLGDYVMVAANLGVFPRGSLVPSSLGMAIVCDTGGFAHANPTQLDIATAW